MVHLSHHGLLGGSLPLEVGPEESGQPGREVRRGVHSDLKAVPLSRLQQRLRLQVLLLPRLAGDEVPRDRVSKCGGSNHRDAPALGRNHLRANAHVSNALRANHLRRRGRLGVRDAIAQEQPWLGIGLGLGFGLGFGLGLGLGLGLGF